MRFCQLILLSVLLSLRLFGQQTELPSSRTILFKISPADSVLALPDAFVRERSERVLLDSTIVLRRDADYSIRYRDGRLALKPAFILALASDSSEHRLLISYTFLPLGFKREYVLRPTAARRDSQAAAGRIVPSTPRGASVDDIFGPDLQRSGTIYRGFTLGSNRDLSLNSGFRLQLSGRIASDLDLVAALTDENSPIQPEGTTQTLQEVDKIFVEVNGKGFNATLGDFNFQRTQKEGGEFGGVFRKLQGAWGTLRFKELFDGGSTAAVSVLGGAPRGKYASNQFQGIEGIQGPYRLTGQDAASRPIIIAGSERVYVNGELMVRGETQDYTIDYSTGEVTFSPRRLITNASRITVDFEYTDRSYARNLIGATAAVSALSGRVQFNAMISQESDDVDAPIDVSLDDATRALLRESGSDRLKASFTGVRIVGFDSVLGRGKGQYERRDTTVNGRAYPVYFYAPGSPRSVYTVTFSYIGQVPPDSAGYARIGPGQFQFAGMGKGNYLPVQFVPLPELHRMLSTTLTAAPVPDVDVSAEFAISQLDRNRISGLDDNDRQGSALKFSARYHPKKLMLGTLDLGELSVGFSGRSVQRQFAPLDRMNEIEFNRKWDISNSAASDELTQEASLAYHPIRELRLSGGYGSMERTGIFRSQRLMLQSSLADSGVPTVEYGIEQIRNLDAQRDEKSSWVRQRATIGYTNRWLEPAVRVEMEERQHRPESSDSLFRGSFRFVEIAPRLGVGQMGPMSAAAEVQFRTEDSTAAGILGRAFRSVTQMYTWQLRNWNSVSSSVSLSTRRVEFTDAFKNRGNANSTTTLLRMQSRYAPRNRALDLDVFYEYAGERSAQLERVFLRVAKGSGNYRYVGDSNGNGVAEESEFQQTRFDGDYVVLFLPADQLVPVASLKTGFRVRLQSSRLFEKPDSFLERALAAISTETVARVEESSTEPDTRRIYLLHFAGFRNPATTIAGNTLVTQDLHLFENDPSFNVRFRFNQRQGFMRLVSAAERSYLRERSVRIRSQLIKEIGNQTEFLNTLNQLVSSIPSPRERDLQTNQVKTEFSYRPVPEWEVTFGLDVSRSINRFEGTSATADLNSQFARLTYALLGAGQVRSEIEREEVALASLGKASQLPFPYEFTNGRAVGKTYLWQLAADYRISRYVQLTVGYSGRSEGGRTPIHTARVEARAMF